jgi:NitT/TauT family transport system permease protein
MAAVALPADSRFLDHLLTSAREFIVGFAAAIVVGVAIGVPAGWYARLRFSLSPVVTAAYAAPRIAVLPLLVLWFGYGPMTTTVVVFLGAVFIVLLGVMAAAATVDQALIRAARAFTAGDLRIFRFIVLPAVVPSIVTAVRLAIPAGLAGVVVGEMYAASAGLGYFIHITASTLQVDKMFVGLLLLAVIGLLLNMFLSALERRFAAWRPEVRPA